MRNVQEHKLYSLAETYVKILEKAFPRRKFAIEWPEKHLRIAVVDAFTYIQLAGPRSVTCHIRDTVFHVTTATIADKLQLAFETETALRQKHSKQRTQIRTWLSQLETSEMFVNNEFVATHKPYSGNPKFAPEITWAWKDIPDIPVVSIRFNTYRNVWNGTSNFRVEFGDVYNSFNLWSEVLSFFNGTEVFKSTDKLLSADDFKKMPTRPGREGAAAPSESMVIRFSDLERATPNLLLMNAKNLEVIEITTQMRVWYARADEEAVFQTFMPKKTTESFIRFDCHPELQWDFHYRDKTNLEPEDSI